VAEAADRFAFEHLTCDRALDALEPEWLELFDRSGTRNPFAHPAWVRVWLRHFASHAPQRLVVAARRDGELVAVAPFVRRTFGRGPLQTTQLMLLGKAASKFDRLSEMTEVLTSPDERRRTLRALIHHLVREQPGTWDWLSITAPPEHGWVDPEWVPETWLRRGARPLHKHALAFVVLPLPARWEDLALKRNMKEAIRRSRNRLAANGNQPEIGFVSGFEARTAVAQVQDLHRRRAALEGHRAHSDYFANPASARFATDAAVALAAAGNAKVALLRLGDVPIAGRLVLRANDSLFLSFSGADPDHWRLGAATSVMSACIRDGIANGQRLLNLSAAPDSAKLRWSEQLELHHEFVLVAPTRRARRAFGLYWLAREHRALPRGGTFSDAAVVD
jgi:CelD/BcsL family acetyltransferase involved in cellulose biosynthesis